MAKIALQCALRIFPDLTGDEPEFGPIRNFIWAGGNADAFVRQSRDQFVAMEDAAPANYIFVP